VNVGELRPGEPGGQAGDFKSRIAINDVVSVRGLSLRPVPSQLSRMALAPGARVGPYEVLAVIGEGGMGSLAHHTALKRDDTLKVLRCLRGP
jgi:hypothetical protein